MTTEFPKSPHLTFEALGSGLYAALATREGNAHSNAGVIDLGDALLIFDATETPEAAADLKAAAERMGKPVRYLINSHGHADHWLGNQIFAETASLITSEGARRRMLPVSEQFAGWKQSPKQLQEALDSHQSELEEAESAEQRAQVQRMIDRLRYLLDNLDVHDPRVPALTFDGALQIHGSKRSVTLQSVPEAAHSPGDIYMLFPDEGAAFVGDLGFFGRQPYMGDCDPQAWQALLRRLAELNLDVYVPGHGPLGTSKDLLDVRDYVRALTAHVRSLMAKGLSLAEALAAEPPLSLTDWYEKNAQRFRQNVKFLYQRLATQ